MFQVREGKRYEFLQREKYGIRRFTARVTSVEDRNSYQYVGFTPDDFRIGRWGFTRVYPDGSYKPYGIIIVKECC